MCKHNAPSTHMFVWNAHLTSHLSTEQRSTWTLPLIHGFFDSKQLMIHGRVYILILLARRSIRYAGTRYLRRGISREGFVANEVETEQILIDEEMRTNTQDTYNAFTSFVHHRGSIPILWTQDVNNLTPKPPLQSKLQLRYADRQSNTVIHTSKQQWCTLGTCLRDTVDQLRF